MKKVLLIAAVAAVAGLAQSAVVQWQVKGAAASAGQVVYLVLNSDIPAEVTSLSDITGKAFASGTIVKAGRNYGVAGETDSDKFTAGQTYSYTMFFVDSSTTPNKYLNGGTGSVTAYNANDSATPATEATSTYDANRDNWTSVTGGGGGQDPIPEPTTVALLALGLAAVGLKRKVA